MFRYTSDTNDAVVCSSKSGNKKNECFDGTGDEKLVSTSNVVEFFIDFPSFIARMNFCIYHFTGKVLTSAITYTILYTLQSASNSITVMNNHGKQQFIIQM